MMFMPTRSRTLSNIIGYISANAERCHEGCHGIVG